VADWAAMRDYWDDWSGTPTGTPVDGAAENCVNNARAGAPPDWRRRPQVTFGAVEWSKELPGERAPVGTLLLHGTDEVRTDAPHDTHLSHAKRLRDARQDGQRRGGERHTGARWLSFRCPCGCDADVTLSLQRSHWPRWRADRHEDGSVSVYPSVHRRSCGAHFVLVRNRVVWAE
jgi:hypothetical protein